MINVKNDEGCVFTRVESLSNKSKRSKEREFFFEGGDRYTLVRCCCRFWGTFLIGGIVHKCI